MAISAKLAEALIEHLERSYYAADEDFVFGHPMRGTPLDPKWYSDEFRKALKAAGITDYVRPFHDARHGSLTNGAAAGENPAKLMARAGHRSFNTTKRYVHLAQEVFHDEASALEDRLLGVESSTHLSRPHLIWPHLKPLRQTVSTPGLPGSG